MAILYSSVQQLEKRTRNVHENDALPIKRKQVNGSGGRRSVEDKGVKKRLEETNRRSCRWCTVRGRRGVDLITLSNSGLLACAKSDSRVFEGRIDIGDRGGEGG